MDNELQAFERRRAEEVAAEKRAITEALPEEKMDDANPVGSEPLPEAAEAQTQKDDGDTNIVAPATNGNADATEGDKSPGTEKGDGVSAEAVDEHHGETVVEAAEDTIIY